MLIVDSSAFVFTPGNTCALYLNVCNFQGYIIPAIPL